MINIEEYNAHAAATESAFLEYNAKQKETEPDYELARFCFSTSLQNIKYEDFVKKPYKGKNGQSDGTNVYHPVKGIDSQGNEGTWKAQLPTVLAPKGYCNIKHDNGTLQTIPIVLDMRNPDHKLFYDEFQTKIMKPLIKLICTTPQNYKAMANAKYKFVDGQAYENDPLYTQAANLALATVSLPIRDYAIRKVPVEGSPLKNMFINPLNWFDETKPDEPPSKMRITFLPSPTATPIPITLDELWDISEGLIRDENGVVIKKKPIGFQCSPEIYINKLNVGVKVSYKVVCSSITIFKFFESKVNDTQAVKVQYAAENLTEEQLHGSMNSYVIDLINSKKTVGQGIQQPTEYKAEKNFSPNGDSTQVPSNNTSAGDSLVNVLSEKSAATAAVEETTVSPLFAQQAQQAATPMPSFVPPMNQGMPSFTATPSMNQAMQFQQGGMSGMPSFAPPNMVPNMNGDRLSQFTPSAIPMQPPAFGTTI